MLPQNLHNIYSSKIMFFTPLTYHATKVERVKAWRKFTCRTSFALVTRKT